MNAVEKNIRSRYTLPGMITCGIEAIIDWSCSRGIIQYLTIFLFPNRFVETSLSVWGKGSRGRIYTSLG